jgi:thiol-disulfide isomerase/thioredoxin
MRRVLAALPLVLLLALAGCAATPAPSGPDEPVPTPFQSCPSSVEGQHSTVDGGELVPDLSLPCFVGGAAVRLRGLGQPALINLWASSCAPCRDEMPALQRFADAVGGRALVLGVITADTRTAASWAASDFGVRFPSVWDPDRTLLKALGRPGIPITLFVDAQGVVRHLDMSGSLTYDKISTLAADHLGLST